MAWAPWRDRLARFVSRQIGELRTGGARAVARKLVTAGELAVAVVIVLAARLARPVILIRFGALSSLTLGPLALCTELYACARDRGLDGRRALDFFHATEPVCNRQLLAMWSRVLRVHPMVRSANRVNHWLPGGTRHAVHWPRVPMDLHGLIDVSAPHLSFTPEEQGRSEAALRALGVAAGRPIVAFHARDSVYALTVKRDPEIHDHRNDAIESQLPAMEELVRRGYVALRMGALVEAPLRASNPHIIDYSTAGRSELLDIFLSASCRFYLGNGDGLSCVPMIFRRPVALVSYIPIEYYPSSNSRDLFTPVRLWLRAERRLLTFKEILTSGIGRYMRVEVFERAGIDILRSTPEEITALAVEMDERLNGTWTATEEDESVQRRFWSLFRGSPHHGPIRARISAAFLRRYPELLEGARDPEDATRVLVQAP